MRIEAPTRVQDAPDVNEETFADQDFLQWDQALGRIIGTPGGGGGSTTLAALTDVSLAGTARGDVLYRGATQWNNLAADTAGRFLQTAGPGADPVWADLPAAVAALNDLTDVTLASVAVGDLLARGASDWNNVAAGANGFVLTSNGVGVLPSWQAVGAGAAALDDLTDVTLTAVAQGDLLYRGATDWNNLPPATAGFVLTSGGPAADPAWLAPAAASLTPAVILLPTTDTRNVIQPSADNVQALILQGFSPTHADPLLETRDSAGTPLSQIGPAGRFIAPLGTVAAPGIALLGDLDTGLYGVNPDELYMALGGVPRWEHTPTSDTLFVTPGTLDALRIYSNVEATAGITTRDVAGIILRGKYWTGSASANADAQMNLDVTGNGTWNLRLVNNGVPQFILAQDGAATLTKTDTGSTSAVVQSLTIDRNVSGTPAAGFGSRTAWRLATDTTLNTAAAALDVSWATATHASRRARLLLSVEDDGGTREGLRIDTDGTRSLLGMGGATAANTKLLITAMADTVIPLALKRNSATQSAHLLSTQDQTGAVTGMARILPTGVFSGPGTGTASERYGAGSLAAGINAVAVGSGTSAGHTNVTVIGTNAASAGLSSVVLGTGASAAANSTAIGSTANAGGVGSFALGNACIAAANSVIAIGNGANVPAGHNFSIAMGVNALTTAISQWVMGSSDGPLNEFITTSTSAGLTRRIKAKSSTGTVRDLAQSAATWADVTDATRKGRFVLSVFDTAAREVLRGEADGAAPMLGVLGANAIARPASYTLAGSATRTFPADPTTTYTGILTGEPGTVYAQIGDLNALRAVVSSLLGVVRQLTTDLASTSGYGFLAAA